MRRAIILGIVLFCAGLACLLQARAQYPRPVPLVGLQRIIAPIVPLTVSFNNQLTVASGTGQFSTAATGRVIVVGAVYSIASSGNLASMTIGGISATRRQRATLAGGGSTTLGSDIWTATVPTGTSGTVTATPSSSFGVISMAVASVYNAATEAGTSGTGVTGTGTTNVGASLVIPTNGVGLGNAFCNAGGGTSISWTNLTAALNSNWTGSAVHGFATSNSSGTATRTETCNVAGNQMLTVNAWGP